MSFTIDELLAALSAEPSGKLVNSKATWARIGANDSFDELGLQGDELQNFLSEWVSDNPYSSL